MIVCCEKSECVYNVCHRCQQLFILINSDGECFDCYDLEDVKGMTHKEKVHKSMLDKGYEKKGGNDKGSYYEKTDETFGYKHHC